MRLSSHFPFQVKYSNPVNDAEAEFRFILMNEPETGRVDIELICDYRIKPLETVEVGEIELAANSTDGFQQPLGV